MQVQLPRMRNKLMLACAFVAAGVLAAPGAFAHDYRGYSGYGHRDHDGNTVGALIAGAIIGGVLVNALDHSHHHSYYGSYYQQPAYYQPTYYAPPPPPSGYYNGGYPSYGNDGYYGNSGYYNNGYRATYYNNRPTYYAPRSRSGYYDNDGY